MHDKQKVCRSRVITTPETQIVWYSGKHIFLPHSPQSGGGGLELCYPSLYTFIDSPIGM